MHSLTCASCARATPLSLNVAFAAQHCARATPLSPSLQVAALSRLAHLAFNQQGGILGVRSEAFQPLGELTSLTSLALDSLPLFDLPAQLRGLSALRALDVSSSGCLVDDAFESLLALCALPLTRLSLANGRLVRLPPLPPTLVELSFSMNYALGEARGEDFAPLQGLTQLTSLACAECGLSWLPDEISSLPALVRELPVLDCKGDNRLGSGRMHSEPEQQRVCCPVAMHQPRHAQLLKTC